MAESRPSSDVIRRRRLAALGVVAAAAALVGAAVGAGDGSRGDSTKPAAKTAAASRRRRPSRPSSRSAGARSSRATASSPSTARRRAHALGALGIGSPDQAVRRLAQQAKPYARKTRPVMLALELLADVANRDPGHRRPLPHAPARVASSAATWPRRGGPRRCSCSTSSPGTPTSSPRRATSIAGCASPTSAWRSTPSGTRRARCPARRSARSRPRTSTRSRATSPPSCASTTCPRSSSSCTSSRRT